jgi:predicted enzyme related to lactoylglutathione lyase
MAHGKFVWHDLMSTDVEKSKRFYGELFGWRIEKEPKGPYHLIRVGEQMIGGMLKNEMPGVPSHWFGYVSVENVEGAVETALKHGGKAIVKKEVIPDVGEFAVIADAHGAVTAPFKSARAGGDEGAHTRPQPFSFVWDELLTPDPSAAERFYAALYGWKTQHMPMPNFTYTLWKHPTERDEKGEPRGLGGMMKMPPGVPHPFWLTYVHVPECDATLAKAQKLGAMVPMPAMSVPNVGRFATIIDPTMAAIAVLQPDMPAS